MGLLSFLKLGKEAGDAIASPIEAIGNVFDSLFTSDEERAKGAFVLEKLRQAPQILQGEINKLESQHRSVFVAGWRPFIGWVCGVSLGAFYVPQFMLASVLWIKVCWAAKELSPYPITDVEGLFELVLALLGMAAYRTFEKVTGKTK
jgi:hypothetical protein